MGLDRSEKDERSRPLAVFATNHPKFGPFTTWDIAASIITARNLPFVERARSMLTRALPGTPLLTSHVVGG